MPKCPHCMNNSDDMIDLIYTGPTLDRFYCAVCSKTFEIPYDQIRESNPRSAPAKNERKRND